MGTICSLQYGISALIIGIRYYFYCGDKGEIVLKESSGLLRHWWNPRFSRGAPLPRVLWFSDLVHVSRTPVDPLENT